MTTTEEDMLSRLPEQILDIILCFLPQKEAVRTCVLSKSWRHLGPCRSKLELCHVTDFNSDGEKFLSFVYNTLQRYHHQNIFLKQLFLKQLSLKTTFSCDPPLRLDLPWLASIAQLLEELYLESCNLLIEKSSRLMFKHLRKLSLVQCDVTEEVVEMLLSTTTCPLLDHIEIWHNNLSSINVVHIPTLETISIAEFHLEWCFLDNNYFPRLKSLRFSHARLSSETFDFFTSNYMPSLEKLELHDLDQEFQLSSNASINYNYFPRLKYLSLTCVKLSSRTFGFFTSKYMPSLEKLELELCYSCQEFKLSSSSIKYLSIICFRDDAIKAAIDAPNISFFKLEANHPLPSLSFTPMISSEWKSLVHLTTNFCYDRYDHTAPCLGINEIHQLLKSLSQSQITLQLFLSKEYQRHRIVNSTKYGGLYKNEPLAVEHLGLELGDYSLPIVQLTFGYMFRVCRPRYIYDVHIYKESKDISRISTLWTFLLYDRKKMCYFWNQDLMEVSMESSSCDMNPEECQSIPAGNRFSECDNQNIRFRLKWRGM